MARRQYYGAATPTTITSSITTSSSSVAIAAYTGWPTGSFSLVIDPGLSSEEKILATSQTTGTITFTTRGYDGTTASAHNAGAVIYPVPTAVDFDEANAVTTKYSATGDLTYASAANTPATLSIGATNNQLAVIGGIPAWIASPDVPKSTVTAKGDIITATASGTPSNLPVGSDGQTLVADSSTSTGLRYQTGVNTNAVINGGMDIWQRGTSFTTTSATTNFAADRWCIYNGRTGTTYSRQSSGLTGFNYSMRVQRDSGNATTSALYLTYTAETQDSLRFAGQTATVSFYAKAGANYSSASSALTGILTYGTGTDQIIWSFTGSTASGSTTATLTTSWQRFTFTASVSSSATELGLTFVNTPVGTAGANDYFEITGVQLELGSVATTFKRAGGTLQQELAACQRYYWRSVAGSLYQSFGIGQAYSTSAAQVCLKNPVTMRTTPTAIEYSTLALSNVAAGVNSATLALSYAGVDFSTLTATSTGLVAGNATILSSLNSTSAYIGLTAEL